MYVCLDVCICNINIMVTFEYFDMSLASPRHARKVVLMPVFKPTVNSCTYSTCGWSLIGKHRTRPTHSRPSCTCGEWEVSRERIAFHVAPLIKLLWLFFARL